MTECTLYKVSRFKLILINKCLQNAFMVLCFFIKILYICSHAIILKIITSFLNNNPQNTFYFTKMEQIVFCNFETK